MAIVEYEWDGLDGHPADSFATWLSMHILSGNGPDMVEYGGYYSPAVASGKLMEDLYPYMDADESFQKEDYYVKKQIKNYCNFSYFNFSFF